MTIFGHLYVCVQCERFATLRHSMSEKRKAPTEPLPAAPPKVPHRPKPWSEETRKANKFGSITDFFKPPPKKGRPARAQSKKRGRAPAELAEQGATADVTVSKKRGRIPAELAQQGATAESGAAPKAKRQRVNYSTGEPFERLKKAVSDWDNKAGDYLVETPMSMQRFAQIVRIPYATFSPYVCEDKGKRKVVGIGVGPTSLLDADATQFVADVLRRRDRGNDGVNRREGADLVQDLMPELSRTQAVTAFRRVRAKNDDVLSGIVKANRSTEKRSAITVPQQFRWHQAVDAAFAFLREKNTGLTPGGQTFGEVMPYFVFGGDETCLLASDGDVSIIGDKAKPKHDVAAGSSRTSITMYRVGSAAGADGPTGFLPPGARKKTGYDDDFLIKHGASAGSTFAMTPTGYMTEEAWVELAPKMAAGIRAVPVVCDMPDWWVLKIVDGFGPHVSSETAMQIYADHKIVLLKEEGDSSHVNQSYDQHVAKADKKSMRAALGYLRSSAKLNKSVVDGWQLVHVGLSCVRELDADAWISSFKKVNLHPHHRVGFPAWCKRIEHYLQGGESFKPEVVRDTYALLPSFWHGMTPEEKKHAVEILAAHDNSYSPACVKDFHSKLHVPMPDMQNVRVCLELAANDPSHLERGVPERSTMAAPTEVTEAQAAMTDVNDGLVSFQLHPKKADGTQCFTGLQKFEHLSKVARRSVSSRQDLTPSAYLNVEFSSMQQRLLNPKPVDFMMHEIAAHAHGEGAKQAMAQRKLDALGNVRGDCGFANDPERMRRLNNQLKLTASLAEISKETQAEKETKASQLTTELIDKAPAACAKLKEKGGDVSKLSIKDMDAIAFKHFKGAILKGDKAAHVKALSALITQQPDILKLASPAEATPPALTTTAAAAPALTVTAAPAPAPALATTPVEATPAQEPLPKTQVVPLAQRKPSRSKAKGKAA